MRPFRAFAWRRGCSRILGKRRRAARANRSGEVDTLPAFQRLSVGVLALVCLGVLALGGLVAWRAHVRPAGPDLAGAVLVTAMPTATLPTARPDPAAAG